MSQQSMRKAALFAASDTHRSQRRGADGGSRAVPIEVQDHGAVENPRSSSCRGTPRGYWLLSACPQVPAAIAKLHSFRTIQM
jgi:hypothetical protein